MSIWNVPKVSELRMQRQKALWLQVCPCGVKWSTNVCTECGGTRAGLISWKTGDQKALGRPTSWRTSECLQVWWQRVAITPRKLKVGVCWMGAGHTTRPMMYRWDMRAFCHFFRTFQNTSTPQICPQRDKNPSKRPFPTWKFPLLQVVNSKAGLRKAKDSV